MLVVPVPYSAELDWPMQLVVLLVTCTIEVLISGCTLESGDCPSPNNV